MPRSDRYSLLRTQLMATTLLCGCDDQSGEALSRIPLYDTTIICVVTSECCMATMRRVLTAFAAAVPTSESFDDVACMKLFHQLQEVRNIPFRVVHGFDVLGSPKAAFEPVDDTDVDPDALLVVLPCVVIGTDTICLRPQFAHSWERVPYSGVSIPSGISSVESSPGLQPKVVSPRASDGSGSDMASRRSHPTPIPSSRTSFPFSSKRVWACPTCHAKAFRSKSHHTPTHWCLACRRCNICVASGHEEGRDRTPYLLRPCEYPLPHQDVDLSILLSRLDAHNVIAVIIALMCDRMVSGCGCVDTLHVWQALTLLLPVCVCRCLLSARTLVFWQTLCPASCPCSTHSNQNVKSFRYTDVTYSSCTACVHRSLLCSDWFQVVPDTGHVGLPVPRHHGYHTIVFVHTGNWRDDQRTECKSVQFCVVCGV